MSPEELRAYISAEVVKWREIITRGGSTGGAMSLPPLRALDMSDGPAIHWAWAKPPGAPLFHPVQGLARLLHQEIENILRLPSYERPLPSANEFGE